VSREGDPLPHEIVLGLGEATTVLFALDAAVEALPQTSAVRRQLNEAVRIIVEKFLPDLRDL
jgi:hypothetical protein